MHATTLKQLTIELIEAIYFFLLLAPRAIYDILSLHYRWEAHSGVTSGSTSLLSLQKGIYD